MITEQQAEEAFRDRAKVVYRSHPSGQPEEGLITSMNSRGVFVRYGADYNSKHTRLADLELTAPAVPAEPTEKLDSVTHYRCNATPADGRTHHMERANDSLRCMYCGWSEGELRRMIGLAS
jgi:hypothetical protein